MFKRTVVIVFALCSMLFLQNRAYAQVATLGPAFTGGLNTEIAAAVAANLARRGVVVGAAALAATMSGLSTAAEVATAAGAGIMAVGTSPVWGSVALGVGALAAVGGVAWGTYKLLQNNASSGTTPDGQPMPASITLQVQTSSGSGSSGGGVYYVLPSCTSSCPQGLSLLPNSLPYYSGWSLDKPAISSAVLAGSSGADLANQEAAALARWLCGISTIYQGCSPSIVFAGTSASVEPLPYTLTVSYNVYSGGASSLPVASTYTMPSSATKNPAYVNPNLTGTLTTIAPNITSGMLPMPLPVPLVAAMANQLWQDASAAPGYAGIPYSATAPISAADIAASPVQATFNDLVNATPAQVGASTIPFSTTGTYSTSAGSTTSSGGTTIDDMCVNNPNSVACSTLGSAPSAPTLPASSVQVPMTPWSVGPSSGTCPADKTVNVFGQQLSFSFSPVCKFAQGVQPIVLVLCALAAALIVVAGI